MMIKRAMDIVGSLFGIIITSPIMLLSNGDDFEAFIDYSRLAALGCAREIEKGCIAPSPSGGVCEYCPYGGVCGADAKKARKESAVKCAEIAKIVKKRRGEL